MRVRRRGCATARNGADGGGVSIDSVRTCLGCRQRATTPFLLRVVVSGGEVVADPSATLPGRGAWVHPRIDCVDTALTRKAFGRALRRTDAAIDADSLRQAIATIPVEPLSEVPSEPGIPPGETDGPPGPR